MARLPRLTVGGYPHHIVLRGNNRQAIFSDTRDYEDFLAMLEAYSKAHKIAIHAYVLMSNHLHLLATPEDEAGIPRMMQGVGREYVRLFNRRHSRTGTLWEGRYRSTLIQAERYLLACMVYIDLNPVRASMVTDPANYPWSSHGHYIGLRTDRLVTPHPLYWQLGNTPFSRDLAYAELVRSGLTTEQQNALSDSVLRGWALGEPDHLAELQQRTPRRLLKGKPGRPPSSVPD